MNKIGKFMLGAAMLVAVGQHARAEDAVVADEFEQQQAVNACDAYGSGYAKLPGTNTCARVSGQLRYEKHFSGGPDRSGGYLDFETRSD